DCARQERRSFSRHAPRRGRRALRRPAMNRDRIDRELLLLSEGNQSAELFCDARSLVLYRAVPTDGASRGLPLVTDVVVPVPDGYPGSLIDLAGLPLGSPFLTLVKGGGNNQGIV